MAFFEPRIIGDAAFYDDFYRNWDVHTALTFKNEERADYKTSAKHIPKGAKVIDIGCGPGVFREHLPHAHYTGLDPYAAPEVDDVVVRETLEVHAEKRAGFYDVATAYHVIEHAADTVRCHAELMVKLIKAGRPADPRRAAASFGSNGNPEPSNEHTAAPRDLVEPGGVHSTRA